MSKFLIIADTEKLASHVTLTLKQYVTVGEKLHVAVISAIWHACKHGNPAILNRVYEGLRSNDQTALKLYVRRASAINGMALAKSKFAVPDGLPSEQVTEFVNAGTVLGFEKGLFTVANGHTSAQAKQMLALCEERFINPDGENDRMVFDRNNFAEVKTLGDVEVLSAIEKQVKAALGADTDTKKHVLTGGTKTFLQSIMDMIDTRKGQLTLNEG